jgi:hypothetical protein
MACITASSTVASAADLVIATAFAMQASHTALAHVAAAPAVILIVVEIYAAVRAIGEPFTTASPD